MAEGEASRERVLVPAANQSPAKDSFKGAHMAEVRIEGSSVSALEFSEPCLFCGKKKRRALLPPTRERKKVLVFEEEEGVDDPACCHGEFGARVAEEDDEGRVTTTTVLRKKNAGVPASPPSRKEDKKADLDARKAKKASTPSPRSNKKQVSLTRDEGTEVMVSVNGSPSVVLTGGKLDQVKLFATCKCQLSYEIVL